MYLVIDLKKIRNYAYLVGSVGEGGRREVDGTGSGWFVVAAGGGEAQRVAPVDGGWQAAGSEVTAGKWALAALAVRTEQVVLEQRWVIAIKKEKNY